MAGFNRRMRKTARPVVWEGDGAQSPSLDPISQPVAMSLRLTKVDENQGQVAMIERAQSWSRSLGQWIY